MPKCTLDSSCSSGSSLPALEYSRNFYEQATSRSEARVSLHGNLQARTHQRTGAQPQRSCWPQPESAQACGQVAMATQATLRGLFGSGACRSSTQGAGGLTGPADADERRHRGLSFHCVSRLGTASSSSHALTSRQTAAASSTGSKNGCNQPSKPNLLSQRTPGNCNYTAGQTEPVAVILH